MLIVSLFVYATALARSEAVEIESDILVPLSAGFLFGSGDWRQKNSNPYRNRYKPFRYINDLKLLYRRAGDDDCRVCYGAEDCFVMNQARCDYYVYTAEIMDLEESGETLDTAPELKFEVDAMLYNLVDRASGDPRYTDCIPLLSRYSDCTKDNICLGCKTCECDVEGRWNCTLLARCRPESDLHEIDHRMLQSVIENLKKDQAVRRKRSEPITQETVTLPYEKDFDDVSESNTEASDWDIKMLLLNSNSSNEKEKTNNNNVTEKSKLRLNEISEWLQEMHLNIKDNKSENTVVPPVKTEDRFAYNLTTVNDISFLTDKNKLDSAKYESDYLAFDEVLNNISVDSKNSSRRKPMPDINPVDHIADYEYMSDDEDTTVATEKYISDANIVYNTVTQSSFKLDKAAVTEAIEKSITEIVIDLLESAKMNDNLNYLNDRNFALLDYMDISDKLNTTFPKPRPDNDGSTEINSVNIMKRDVHNATVSIKVHNVTTTIVTTDKTTSNMTGTTVAFANNTNLSKHIDDLNKNVVFPLTAILNQKENETEELTKIRTNLINFLDDFRNNEVNFSYSGKNESFLYNYKRHFITKIKDVKLSNRTIKDNYSLKLKHDVYEVIKDVVGIQKLSDSKKLPDDLKFLIRAMKHYVHKQGFHINKINKKDNFRRRWNTVKSIGYDPIREKIVNILEVIDKEMPLSTGLYPLSKTAKKILKRIIKQHYIDEFAMIGLRVYDPNYNLTNDLRNIGTKWKKMMDGISASSLPDELYTTKLLHLEISVDISKMNDALSLINFAHRRSMVPVDEVIGEEIITQISDSLDKINKKIVNVVQRGAISIKRRTKYWSSWHTTTMKSTVPKMSFLQQIKSLLHNSKRDIMDLIKKRVPKTDVLKELARKQLDINKNKLSEYERTMSSWQHNFGILPNIRERRGSDYADRRDRNRIKNIIPRYLRGKVRPAINKKSNKKAKTRKSNNNTGHKTKTSSFSTSTSSTSTSSGTKISTSAVTPPTSLKPKHTSKKP